MLCGRLSIMHVYGSQEKPHLVSIFHYHLHTVLGYCWQQRNVKIPDDVNQANAK